MSKKKKPTIIDNSSDSIEALDMKIESVERSIYDISKQLCEVSSDTLDDSYECEGDCYCSKCHFEDSTDEDTNENLHDTNECEIEETSLGINENALTKDDQSIIDTNEKDQISEITKSQDNDNIHDKKKSQDAINIHVKNNKKGQEHANTKGNDNQIHDNSNEQDTLHKSNGLNVSPKNDSTLDLKGIEQTPKYIRIIDTPPSPCFPKIDSHLLFNFFNPNFQFNFLFHFEKHTPMMKQNNIKNIKSTETQRRIGNKSGRENEIEQIEKKYIEKYEKSVKGKFEKNNNQQKDVHAYRHTDNANNSTGNSNYKIIDNANKFTDNELHAQIENDPFYNFNCDNDPFYNRYPCSYSTFIDPTFNDFSTPENRYSHFLKNPIANLTNIFNRPYSAPPRSLIERIDSEHPNFESSEYKGCSRATTPIGFHPFLKEIRISDNYKNEFENEIEMYLNQNDGRKTEGGYKTNLETQGSYKNIPNKSDTKNVDELTNKKVFSVEQGDTINNSVFLCMDQEGSRFIQKRLEKSTKKEIQWFYYSIKSHLKTLCLDLFGNYVIQKIIDLKLINDDISLSLIPFVKELSLHMYGCRVIQKILDHDNNTIMDIIKENAILLIEDQNGNHVIQKCVEKNGDINLIGIYKAHTIKLCKHRYGCRVIQRLFEHCDDSAVIDIILNLTKEIEMMMEDQYGNYVLQHIIENKVNLRNIIIDSILCIGRRKVEDKNEKKGVNKKKTNVKTSETITKAKNTVGSSDTNLKMTVSDKITIVKNNDSSTENSYLKRVDALNLDDYDTARLLHFCSHKFASNVIEKCVMYSPLFVDIFLRKVNGKPMVVCMASDKFGNYVVQRVLDNKMVRNCLKQWCSELKKSVYAKHILSKIQ